MNAIETVALTKYYGKSRGIIDVDLLVKEGDFFGFIGPNGAGKSTFIRTLLGLVNKTSGEGKVLGCQMGSTELLSRVGYLSSEPSFYRGMKVKDIITLSARLRNKDCSREAYELCSRLELDMGKKIDELSLGNKKKVGIVCAMQHRPDLYILDEPTSGLDPLVQREFYTLLKERNSEGATVFLSSHVLSEVSRYCKNAAVISNGRILVCDSVEKLGHTGAKRVVIQGLADLPLINGISDIKNENGSLSFLYRGEVKKLISELESLSFTDLTLTDPDLEEVFMHYYEGEKK